MFGRQLLSGLAIAGVATMHLMSTAQAQERMRLGAPVGPVQFQSDVGDRVFFSEGSAVLGARARTAIGAQAAWLLRHPLLPVTVEGHADEPGSAAYNLEVSQRRAQAVRTELIARGVPAARIAVAAYGRGRPVAECAGASCAAQTRRTVTVLGQPATPPAGAGSVRDRPSAGSLF